MKKIIAVTMCHDASGVINEGVEYDIIRREYGESIKNAGGEPIFVDSSVDPRVVASIADGVVISGGQDIDPRVYGKENTHCGIIEPIERTMWECTLIDVCDEFEVPILGICYGSQLLNVHYGGTIYQDIATEHGSKMSHGTSAESVMHDVTFSDGLLGYKKGQVMPSAARHHQAVRDIAPGFSAVAHAEDGVVEAIKGRGHYGIQWHPESNVATAAIYKSFVDECLEKSAPRLSEQIPVLEGNAV